MLLRMLFALQHVSKVLALLAENSNGSCEQCGSRDGVGALHSEDVVLLAFAELHILLELVLCDGIFHLHALCTIIMHRTR